MIDYNKLQQEIISIIINSDSKLSDIYSEFFQILRKHGIKQGTKAEGYGVICNNIEWTIAESFLKQNFELFFTFRTLGIEGKIPKDLEY